MSTKLEPDEALVQVQAISLQHQETTPGTSPRALIGTVTKCGFAAKHLLGQQVFVTSTEGCDECDSCSRGLPTHCIKFPILNVLHSELPSEVTAKARWLTILDEQLQMAPAIAAMVAGPVITAYALYCKAGVHAGDQLVVYGKGPEASILAALGESRGAKVLTSKYENDESQKKFENTLATLEHSRRPQKIFVCDGESGLAAALRLAPAGSAVTVYHQSRECDLSFAASKELTLCFLRTPHPDLITECAALVLKGELNLSGLMETRTRSAFQSAQVHQEFCQGKTLVIEG